MTNKKRKLIIGYNSSEHTHAAELIGSNADILTEILTHVPAKFLIRFKCVSKDWRSLISDSQFSCNHSHRNPNALFSGLFINPCTSDNAQVKSVSLHGHHRSLPTLSFLNGVGGGSGTYRIEDSCKGLLLCLNGTCFIVCNPTTQKYTVLPYPYHGGTTSSSIQFRLKYGVFWSSSGSFGNMFGGYLVFDPSKSRNYKVVLISYIRNSDGCFYLIDIYSSESASWTYMRATAPPGYSFTKRVFWNGAIHWMSYDNIYIRLDVDAQKLIGTPMPSYPKILSEEKIWYFGECFGHLLLVQLCQCCAMGFKILEMERDCCCWIEKYQVSLGPIISLFPGIDERRRLVLETPSISKISVLCAVKGSNEKDFTLVLSIPGKIVSYNLKCKTVKVLCDYQTGFYECPGYKDASCASYAFKYVYEFHESLAPV